MAGTILLTLCLLFAPGAVPAADSPAEICVASELTVAAVRGQVLFTYREEERPGAGAEVELMEFRDDGWHTLTKITADGEGRFAFPAVRPGDYQLVARSSAHPSTGAYVRVKKRANPGREIVIPLRPALQGCAYAKLRKRA